jgi:hypothetical protein
LVKFICIFNHKNVNLWCFTTMFTSNIVIQIPIYLYWYQVVNILMIEDTNEFEQIECLWSNEAMIDDINLDIGCL